MGHSNPTTTIAAQPLQVYSWLRLAAPSRLSGSINAINLPNTFEMSFRLISSITSAYVCVGSGQAEQIAFATRILAGSGREADVGDEFETTGAGLVAEEMTGAALGVERPAARLPDFAQFAADELGDENCARRVGSCRPAGRDRGDRLERCRASGSYPWRSDAGGFGHKLLGAENSRGHVCVNKPLSLARRPAPSLQSITVWTIDSLRAAAQPAEDWRMDRWFPYRLLARLTLWRKPPRPSRRTPSTFLPFLFAARLPRQCPVRRRICGRPR
jgi:hypothetical protein